MWKREGEQAWHCLEPRRLAMRKRFSTVPSSAEAKRQATSLWPVPLPPRLPSHPASRRRSPHG